MVVWEPILTEEEVVKYPCIEHAVRTTKEQRMEAWKKRRKGSPLHLVHLVDNNDQKHLAYVPYHKVIIDG